jgi:hypothetical protein
VADNSRMQIPERSRSVFVAVALTAALAAPSAAAASTHVSGKIQGADHYKLLELARAGNTIAVVLHAGGTFRVPAHRGSTLQLIKPNGIYFGPLVIAHRRGKGWDALTGKGLRLGNVALHRGYASPIKMPPLASVKTSTWFHVTAAGSPLGAGHLGFIVLTHHALATRRERAHAANGPGASGPQTLPAGGDPTQDGIPTAFNAGSAVPGETAAENPQDAAKGAGGGYMTSLNAQLQGSVNADAGNVTAAEVSQQAQNSLGIEFGLQSDQVPAGTQSASVDCSALSYCSGITVLGPSFSGDEQAPGSIWNGTIPANQNSGFQINLKPNAPLSEIQPGDTFLINYQTAAGVVQVPTSLTTMFVTVPALAAIGQGTGSAASSSMQPISYPTDNTTLGTIDNPVMMTGDSISVSFWRPQRAAFPGETGPYMDLGHLHYGLSVSGSSGSIGCAESDFSNLSPTLSLDPTPGVYTQMQPLLDSSADATPDPSNQLSATLNLTDCLEQNNQPTTGAELTLGLGAADPPQPTGGEDTAGQDFYVCLPGCTVGQVAGPGAQNGPGPTPSPAPASETAFQRSPLTAPWLGSARAG